MAVASTYVVFPNDVLLTTAQRVFDDMSLGNGDQHKLNDRRQPSVDSRPSVTLQSRVMSTTATVTESAVSLSQQQMNSSKKSLSSRPFDILRWLTPKSRRKDKETTASTPSPVSAVVTATGNIHDDSRPYLDDDLTQERILDIDLSPLVVLPGGVELNEWLASHTMSFFEHINLFYGSVSEFCCQSSVCTSMIGPGNTQYHWIDERGKRTKCSAPQYVDYVMSFSHKLIYDETVFPTKYGNLFPSSFETTIKKIHRLLLHVIAHIYQCHWQQLVSVRLLAHVNTLTYHFLLFNKQFSLVDDKEMEVLDDLLDRLQFHSSSSRRLASRIPPSEGVSTTASTECLTERSVVEDNKENIINSDGLPATSAVLT